MKGFGRHGNLMRPTRIELIKHYVSGAAPVSSLTCGWVSLPREQRMPREDTCKCCSIACRIHGTICYYYFSHSRCLHPGQITQRWLRSLHIIDLKRVTEDEEEEIHRKCNTFFDKRRWAFIPETLYPPRMGLEGLPLLLQEYQWCFYVGWE